MVLACASALALGAVVYARAGRAESGTAVSAATSDKVLRYIRERFGLAETVKMTINSWQPFSDPAFYESAVNVDYGKEKKSQPVYLTRNQDYLVVGKLVPMTSASKEEISKNIRQLFKVPENIAITVGPLRNSAYPTLYATTVSLNQAGKKQTQDFYVTADHRCLVIGNIFKLTVDPRLEALRTITLRNQPFQGAAGAPVTIVEFADLECPMCARLHEFLEKKLVPRYAGKVRVVFKEFPLVQIHDWSTTAAIANECVYRIKPEAYVPYRSLIFESQAAINATNVRDMLLAYGDQLGVDHMQLAGCLDAKSTLPQIDQDLNEGKQLNILSTPTSFVNGRIIVGMPSEDVFYKTVDEALADVK